MQERLNPLRIHVSPAVSEFCRMLESDYKRPYQEVIEYMVSDPEFRAANPSLDFCRGVYGEYRFLDMLRYGKEAEGLDIVFPIRPDIRNGRFTVNPAGVGGRVAINYRHGGGMSELDCICSVEGDVAVAEAKTSRSRFTGVGSKLDAFDVIKHYDPELSGVDPAFIAAVPADSALANGKRKYMEKRGGRVAIFPETSAEIIAIARDISRQQKTARAEHS